MCVNIVSLSQMIVIFRPVQNVLKETAIVEFTGIYLYIILSYGIQFYVQLVCEVYDYFV